MTAKTLIKIRRCGDDLRWAAPAAFRETTPGRGAAGRNTKAAILTSSGLREDDAGTQQPNSTPPLNGSPVTDRRAHPLTEWFRMWM